MLFFKKIIFENVPKPILSDYFLVLVSINNASSVPLFQQHHGFMLSSLTSLLLTWETDTLHVISMVTAQRGMKALEVGVSAGDNGWSLVTAAGLNHVDCVQLKTSRDTTAVRTAATDVHWNPDEMQVSCTSERKYLSQ